MTPLWPLSLAGSRQLSERARAAVVVIHHPSKDNWKNLRGHSSINGAVDLALAVKRDGPGAVDIVFEGNEKPPRAGLSRSGPIFAYKAEGNELLEAQFFGTGHPQPKLDDLSAIDKAKHFIREIAPSKMNQGDLANALKDYKVGNHAARAAIDEMAADGELTIERGERNAKLCSLA